MQISSLTLSHQLLIAKWFRSPIAPIHAPNLRKAPSSETESGRLVCDNDAEIAMNFHLHYPLGDRQNQQRPGHTNNHQSQPPSSCCRWWWWWCGCWEANESRWDENSSSGGTPLPINYPASSSSSSARDAANEAVYADEEQMSCQPAVFPPETTPLSKGSHYGKPPSV